MNHSRRTLVRESFSCDAPEREKEVYSGYLLRSDPSLGEYRFAFRADDRVMRLKMRVGETAAQIDQTFDGAISALRLELGGRGEYSLKTGGYTLRLLTETERISADDSVIEFKYRLLDEDGRVLSFNEVRISGEEEIC